MKENENEENEENEEKKEKKEEDLSKKLDKFSKIKKVDSEIDISIDDEENKTNNFKESGEDLFNVKTNNENNNNLNENEKNFIENSNENLNDSIQNDEMQLPDFYEIDFYDFELKKISENEKNSIKKIKEKYKIKKIVSFNEIEIYLNSKNINLLDFNNFSIEKKHLYQHRDVIFLGNINNYNNEKNCFVKCFNFNNETELNEIMRELTIFFNVFENTNFCNEIFGYYFDDVNKCLYIFYEYFKLKIINVVINYDLKENSEKNSNEEISFEKENLNEKYLILNQLKNFLAFIHSNGIIHRDLTLDYFYYDEEKKQIKIFDFTNSFCFPEEMLKTETEKIDKELIRELKSLMYKDGLFLTPKFIPPELSSESPKIGYFQDIWAFGCMLIELFLDYSKYEDENINPFLTRVFQGDQFNNKSTNEEGDLIIKDAIPKIPKTIPKNIGKIILKCIEYEIYNRITTDNLIDKINSFLKEEKFNTEELNSVMRSKINKMIAINNKLYNLYKDEGVNEADYFYKTTNVIFKNCEDHPEKIKNLYCRNCKDIICDIDYKKEHEGHKVSCLGGINPLDGEKTIDFIDVKKKLRDRQIDIEKIELDRNYKVIEKFCNTFNNDYENEKEKIKKNYENIRKKIKELHKLQINQLNDSKFNFLDSKFKKIFNESKKIGDYCKTFYFNKYLFLSNLNRFNLSFMNKEIDSNNFLLFKKKWEKFDDCTEKLKSTSNELKEKCESLRIPGKYIFRKQIYTENLFKMLKSTESKIHTEQHKFFDFTTPNSLYLTKELLMIIPLTNTIFSYSKNSYKKIKINFEKHKVKINSFLPGCATLHQNEYFFITGGEIKDEATSSFIYMKISQKIIEESIEMNFTRRFHTMMDLSTEKKNYICVIGGWDSKEVEMIETTDGIFTKWLILPSMHKCRSDPTTFLYNKKYLYVFGGWDYTTKKSVNEIERYEIFNGENIKLTKQWERIKIKGESNLLMKYNMGLIEIKKNDEDENKNILLIGGYNENFDYSCDVVNVEILQKENFVNVKKEEKGLPQGGESSFWYEKHFHYMKNDLDGEEIAINFNCFNNLYVYNFKNKTFRQFANTTTKI